MTSNGMIISHSIPPRNLEPRIIQEPVLCFLYLQCFWVNTSTRVVVFRRKLSTLTITCCKRMTYDDGFMICLSFRICFTALTIEIQMPSFAMYMLLHMLLTRRCVSAWAQQSSQLLFSSKSSKPPVLSLEVLIHVLVRSPWQLENIKKFM